MSDEKQITIRAKSQLGLKLAIGISFIILITVYFNFFDSLSDSYTFNFTVLVLYCALALKSSEVLATTYIIHIRRRSISFVIKDHNRRWWHKLKVHLKFSEVLGFECLENKVLIETINRTYSISTIALNIENLNDTSSLEVGSRYLYDLLSNRIQVKSKVDKSKIPILERELFR